MVTKRKGSGSVGKEGGRKGRTGGYVFDHMHENVPFFWSKKLNNITDYFKDKI